MPKLRRFSGKELILLFRQFGFVQVSQKGSHVKLKRFSSEGAQVLTIPAHSEIDPGTLRAILRQASRFIPQDELRSNFYTSS